MMASMRGSDGFVARGAYAAALMRAKLHGTPIVEESAWEKATTARERVAMTAGMELAVAKEKRAAEALASAERARLRREELIADAEASVDMFVWL